MRFDFDNIYQSHVEAASSYLVRNNESKSSKFLGIFGGAFFGAAISNILALTLMEQVFTNTGIAVSIILGIVGSFMIGVSIYKE